MKDGYLIFETDRSDDLCIYLIDDGDLYNKLYNANGNDGAIEIFNDVLNDYLNNRKTPIIMREYYQAPEFTKGWKFNGYNILGTIFLISY